MTSTAVRRAVCVAACAALALTVTACEGGKKNRGGGSHGDSSTQQDEKPQVLKLGQPAPEPQTFSGAKKAKFEVAAAKVTMGKPGDLADLDDQKTAKGKVPAWIYVKAKQVEGGAVKKPMIMSDFGAKASGASAKRLIMIMGELKSTPKDCVDGDDVAWTKGKTQTICDVYLVPEGKKIDEVLLSRGFTAEPQRWTVNK
ncbi:hypothetical protein [Streptomyces sp. NPDC048172]|uniref:hypothetical protein n=1 Tax=Streptomyces sp. NPDC048172 TaxID=3365505 RepID=UPI003713D30D